MSAFGYGQYPIGVLHDRDPPHPSCPHHVRECNSQRLAQSVDTKRLLVAQVPLVATPVTDVRSLGESFIHPDTSE
jgi:hypothetical protein